MPFMGVFIVVSPTISNTTMYFGLGCMKNKVFKDFSSRKQRRETKELKENKIPNCVLFCDCGNIDINFDIDIVLTHACGKFSHVVYIVLLGSLIFFLSYYIYYTVIIQF